MNGDGDGAALAALTDSYLRLLAVAGIIDPVLRDAALGARLHFRTQLPPPAAVSFVGDKAMDRLRAELMTLLHLPDLYALDRLDVSGYGTVDTAAQKRVTDVLERLGDPAYVRDRSGSSATICSVAKSLAGSPEASSFTSAVPSGITSASTLQEYPNEARSAVMEASAEARQEVYGWLFKSRNLRKQNRRIRILLEEDAFDQILQDWRRQGYPFGHLVPSYGSAIGSSGDRPDALVDLMGLILNDGVRQQNVDLQRLHFAADTPYETEMTLQPEPQRVLAPEIARTVRQALIGVVAEGTATRLRAAYRSPDGSLPPVGGKTGTGDNRLDHFGRGGRLIPQRVVDRTATFVFFLGDRFFGTITAYVPGAIAGSYHFTSALAVQLLKALDPLLKSPASEAAPMPIGEALPVVTGLGKSGEGSGD